jgi:signal transduction histidine kinase
MLGLVVTSTLSLSWLAATLLGWAAPFSARTVAVLVLSGAVCLGLVVLGLAVMTRRVARPLGAVMDAADRVAGGDYGVRLNEQGSPPIRGLARSFNAMIDRLRDHDRVRRDLVADVAHELRTPLTVLQGRLEGMLDGVYPRDETQLRQLLDETHVLSRLVEDLRTVALSESGALKLQREPTDVAGLARDVAKGSADAAARRQVTIAVEAPETAPIEVDPLRIREVIGNLVSNAVRHAPSGGQVTIAIASVANALTVEVRDDGPGMTPEELAHAFDRFYKGPESRGSGLGLAIAKALVTAHGGQIHASSTPGQGTSVRVTFPTAI